MTNDQIILFALFGGVFIMLLWGRFRYDIVAFTALLLGIILGVVPKEEAFYGFGHPATLIVALVLIVSAGLVRSGAVLLITRNLVDAKRGIASHITTMGGIGAILSAFMNNVAALALLMPVDIATARKAGRLPGKTLMPLSFATILGGTITLIGTPPNIVIAGIRQDQFGESFRMFDFAPVGLVTALAGLLFVALVGWRLLPGMNNPDTDAQGGRGTDDSARYVAELTVPEGNSRVGDKVSALYDACDETGVHIIGLLRGGRRMFGSARNATIEAGDALILEAKPEELDEFRAGEKLEFSDNRRMTLLDAADQGLSLVEVVVRDDSRINGRSAQAIGLAWRQRTILMGISRRGRRITERLRREKVQAGDILLLLVPTESVEEVVEWLGALPLANRGLAVTENKKVWPAVGLFAAAVLGASFGLIDLTVALGVVVVAYAVGRIVPLHELYDQVEWPVVVLLGSMIPLGAALETSGGTELIAEWLGAITFGRPVWVAMGLLMVVTMVMSAVLNNTATAIVAAPVGIDMARTLGVNPDTFLIAVAISASCAFLTPIGHKNNTLILGPGGYRFGDYWQMGLPLTVLILVVSLPATLFFWPL
ncbi:potassium transporter peripheral membrane component [Jannaschia seosinensis]|uniref:Potassium transporter peripheral membrane component n=1 Tax=Jannaschia seosinensis TaxID=313367 RepID=A0A0M7BCY4_9RHOB|nr:SLC13 family permease [Jannaschia seosinensis]CUH40251.1 potassium transporter peripheral membrane component [Jannaschia seosinensis]